MKSWIIPGISSNFSFNLLNLFIAVLMLLDLNIFDIFYLYSRYSLILFLICFNLNLFLLFSTLSFFRWFWFFILFVSVFFALPFLSGILFFNCFILSVFFSICSSRDFMLLFSLFRRFYNGIISLCIMWNVQLGCFAPISSIISGYAL